MRVHACTALCNMSIYDPFANVLRATTEAMAAVIGGCDSLEVRPFRFSDRLAMNIQRLVQDESHFDRVADPAGGSYYVEWLTDALANQGWRLFSRSRLKVGIQRPKTPLIVPSRSRGPQETSGLVPTPDAGGRE